MKEIINAENRKKINLARSYSLIIISLIVITLAILSTNNVSAAGNATVCCEKTKSNLFCQNVPSDQCDSNSRQAPTSCESTSYCKPGVCYDSSEGTCLDNTPQIVCNNNKGIWSETSPAQCQLGCCVLGDQAAFVSLVRCKKLSGFLGLQTNYNKNIQNEVACVLSVQNQDKGACVYDFEFQKTCKFTTRAECGAGVNGTAIKGQFYRNKLCSAEELGTICGPTNPPKTTCVSGKEEVYFVDTCGNPGNIYDASKANDKRYWGNVVDKSAACSLTGGNGKSCGNCNYLLGSICRKTDKGTGATYGDYQCADLNCKNTQNGKSYKHGESWCVYNDKGKGSVGSRFYKHVCMNGEEVLEQCADFRQEECIESGIDTTVGKFSQAACRVNRWQDCSAQTEKDDCENTDRRDCSWLPVSGNGETGKCVPKNSPGTQFWQGAEAKGICAQASTACTVTFTEGLFGGKEPKSNKECLSEQWLQQRKDVCASIGDCGPKTNWAGSTGYKEGFTLTKTKG